MFTIKICGLTNLDDARWALEAGADYLGFVLYPKSPRHITFKELSRIVDNLPAHAKPVGVFVNEEPILVKEVAEACRLVAVQLNGNEEPEDYEDFGVSVWRAVRLETGNWMPDIRQWKAERYVMDAASPTYGGTGLKIDWEAAFEFASRHRAMLAGGLNPASVAEAIRQVRPLGVDVASGVESSHGKKDRRKVADFIENARAAAGIL
ncbi:MAG: phosphoribosylanthranilate isomerase [bacterium]